MIKNHKDVSAYGGAPPAGAAADRSIAGGPIHSVDTVRQLANQGALVLWTTRAARDAQKWGLDTGEIAMLVTQALDHGRFIGSQWAIQRPEGPWAACDAYALARQEWIENSHRYIAVTYYLKFAIGRTGECLLSVSNHPEDT